MAIGVYDVEQTHDIGVIHFFQDRDLAYGSAGYALIFGFEADLFEGNYALIGGGEVASLVNNAVSS